MAPQKKNLLPTKRISWAGGLPTLKSGTGLFILQLHGEGVGDPPAPSSVVCEVAWRDRVVGKGTFLCATVVIAGVYYHWEVGGIVPPPKEVAARVTHCCGPIQPLALTRF